MMELHFMLSRPELYITGTESFPPSLFSPGLQLWLGEKLLYFCTTPISLTIYCLSSFPYLIFIHLKLYPM